MPAGTNQVEFVFAIVQGLIELFKRHQQGENVTADLNELLEKVTSLKNKETKIANTPVEGTIGDIPVVSTIATGTGKTSSKGPNT